jgi:hypothetical protein
VTRGWSPFVAGYSRAVNPAGRRSVFELPFEGVQTLPERMERREKLRQKIC